MEERIISILNDLCGAEEGEISLDMDLFEEGLLDSFAVIQLFVEREEAFSVSLEITEIPRQEIATPAKIAQVLRRAGGKG